MTPLSRESQQRVDEYLTRLRESLAPLSEGERTDAVEELRTHIEEAVTRIREDETAAVSTVLRGLGEPAQYAAGLMAEDTDEEPGAGPQPVPAAPAAPARRGRSAGWCIAGCIGVPVVLLVLLIGLYLERGSPQPPAVAYDAELGNLREKLLSALERRDAAEMAMLRHPELSAEGGVSGEDLLLPEGGVSLSVGEASRLGPDDIRISVRADDAVYEYQFERHSGQWLIRGVRESAQDATVPRDEGSPEVPESSESD